MRKIAVSVNIFVQVYVVHFIMIITGDITRLACYECAHFSLQPNWG